MECLSRGAEGKGGVGARAEWGAGARNGYGVRGATVAAGK
jgi:hypothetical protein